MTTSLNEVSFTTPHSFSRLTDVSLARSLSLRVPLTTIQSTTHAFYPDETHNIIRRVFTPPNAPHTKRHFCGFCGTALTHWSEKDPEEADYVRVNMGSLKNESMERLEEVGILSSAADEPNDQNEPAKAIGTNKTTAMQKNHGRELRGNPWFEEVIEGSALGRIKRRRGGQSSSNGETTVEWEVVEVEGDGEDITNTGKRKLGSRKDEDDVEMKA